MPEIVARPSDGELIRTRPSLGLGWGDARKIIARAFGAAGVEQRKAFRAQFQGESCIDLEWKNIEFLAKQIPSITVPPDIAKVGDVSEYKYYPKLHSTDTSRIEVDFGPSPKPEADEPRIVFPPSALVGVAADYAHLHAEELEGAVEGFYFSYLTFLGTAVCRHVRLETALPVQPRLYTILLGQSATAKKSSAIDFTDKFFDHVGANSFYTAHGLGSAEGIARLLQDKGLPLLLCFDELKSFVDKTKQEGNVALPMLNTLFEKQKWDNTVKNRKASIALRDAHMSLLAASTTATYEAMWTASYLDIGFINRLLVIPCARAHKVALPRGISHPALRGLVRKTRDQIAAYVKSSKLFRLDPGARTLWEGWYEALEDTVHARRLDTIGLRLMLLLAVTTGARTITTDLVRRVIAILDYELQMRRLTDPVDAVGNIAKLEEKIRRTLQVHGGLKKRDLGKRIHAARYGTWLFNSALKNLIDDGQVGYDKRSKRYDFGPEGKA